MWMMEREIEAEVEVGDIPIMQFNHHDYTPHKRHNEDERP